MIDSKTAETAAPQLAAARKRKQRYGGEYCRAGKRRAMAHQRRRISVALKNASRGGICWLNMALHTLPLPSALAGGRRKKRKSGVIGVSGAALADDGDCRKCGLWRRGEKHNSRGVRGAEEKREAEDLQRYLPVLPLFSLALYINAYICLSLHIYL